MSNLKNDLLEKSKRLSVELNYPEPIENQQTVHVSIPVEVFNKCKSTYRHKVTDIAYAFIDRFLKLPLHPYFTKENHSWKNYITKMQVNYKVLASEIDVSKTKNINFLSATWRDSGRTEDNHIIRTMLTDCLIYVLSSVKKDKLVEAASILPMDDKTFELAENKSSNLFADLHLLHEFGHVYTLKEYLRDESTFNLYAGAFEFNPYISNRIIQNFVTAFGSEAIPCKVAYLYSDGDVRYDTEIYYFGNFYGKRGSHVAMTEWPCGSATKIPVSSLKDHSLFTR